ncbi:Asp-tRNA(Asn)/Glu-tRNA(Gln) amidotransferase subunit GatC [Eupransor demetentiae]|uniref:Aspartyl/glutamyl-tRNA(Asn/Gln) amidotransferase subunit C n=1 Tax=Eupransor demetentiae TaxID=3109584 RepID=A0ABM9N3E7_9LACO|nr:Asp-tRNAAsn/Glu-tRNAGln amidotransferase C subunit (GatC) [Lactobacillaceae bacterium LMG 33000]
MAQKISKSEVAHVASLAKLELSEDELNRFTDQLGQILDLCDTMAEVDTNNVEPTFSVTPNVNHLRADKAENWDQSKALLANAPQEAADLIKVPAILKGEE